MAWALDVEQVFAVEQAIDVEQAQRSIAWVLAFEKNTSALDVEQVLAVEWALDVEQALCSGTGPNISRLGAKKTKEKSN